jgi:DNA modification methylase
MPSSSLRLVNPIHPFPARMAPEVALAEVTRLTPGSLVLDPMAGSGTVLRAAAAQGHRAIGFDLDPLAVLMARVWTTPIETEHVQSLAAEVVERARALTVEQARLPWIDDDQETRRFVDYWFAAPQQGDLRRLSTVLHEVEGPPGDALRLALSRIIITKDRGASLARDVSHSRPHRVRAENAFPVFGAFLRSVERMVQRLREEPPPGSVSVHAGDARRLDTVLAGSIDAVITSPPYLNAIDYLRGHRFSLVWLGYSVGATRDVRAASIGAERAPDAGTDARAVEAITALIGSIEQMPRRVQRMIDRYAGDLHRLLAELYRVIRSKGKAVLVIGNSCLRGVFIHNAAACFAAAERAGFTLADWQERELPPNRRYLPPPASASGGQRTAIEKRMRTETVLTFVKS